ncbi:hypothetical protein [Pannonibacter phragmitetus]|uniref:hypothetical protein n=1 Tax=Pannonibacter phragmitetus TaxID=121719 RepID=UPI000B9731FE|nr:hypothetical protein [Pannonibacter phragmitetus]
MSDGDIRINALPAAGSVTGTEVLPGMQGMATLGITTQQIADLAAALVRGGVPSNLDTLADIVAAFLPLTGGTLTGPLSVPSQLVIRSGIDGGSVINQLTRYDGTTAARFAYVPGSSPFLRIGVFNPAGNGWVHFVDLPENPASPPTLTGHVIVTSANIQSYLGTLLPDYVSGMAVSYVNATTCSVAAGQARIGATAVSLASAMTKRLDAAWTAGSGNGGLDTGTVQPNATYHLRAIRNASTGVADLLWSASAAAPTIPSGWNSIQRLQAVKTDGSGNIRPFVTDGRETRLLTPVNEYSGAGARALALITCAGLPTGIRVQALLQSGVYTAGSTDGGVRHTLGDGHQSSVQQAIEVYHSSGAKGITVPVACYTNTSAQIFFAVQEFSAPASINTLTTLGWVDHSIPRI